ncbi:hypothetical protein PbDSM24746_62840 [Paenibacillus macerans]|uniref:hypothetical protein n=1 Tax=Paenibacillus macerans TaxID=44252 RepID=UPI000ED4A97A|nr:hypothetical protein [Paenibacillus macerans]GBK66280.1 hypothetical protein PbDSM24746_62840 [Paenibacillus macerans]
MTIIPEGKLKHDPQRLLYHFPSINKVKYTKLSQEFYFWHSVSVAEETARMFGRLLVPARCLHWERKTRLADRRLQIGKKSVYVAALEELTEVEKRKYFAEIELNKEA